jgi:hypothetical protein
MRNVCADSPASRNTSNAPQDSQTGSRVHQLEREPTDTRCTVYVNVSLTPPRVYLEYSTTVHLLVSLLSACFRCCCFPLCRHRGNRPSSSPVQGTSSLFFFRHEFYETDEKVTLSIFDKGVKQDEVQIKFLPRSVSSLPMSHHTITTIDHSFPTLGETFHSSSNRSRVRSIQTSLISPSEQ